VRVSQPRVELIVSADFCCAAFSPRIGIIPATARPAPLAPQDAKATEPQQPVPLAEHHDMLSEKKTIGKRARFALADERPSNANPWDQRGAVNPVKRH
jgi:hypothetical protein